MAKTRSRVFDLFDSRCALFDFEHAPEAVLDAVGQPHAQADAGEEQNRLRAFYYFAIVAMRDAASAKGRRGGNGSESGAGENEQGRGGEQAVGLAATIAA